MSPIGSLIKILALWSGYIPGIFTSPIDIGPFQNVIIGEIQLEITSGQTHTCNNTETIQGGYIQWPEHRTVGSTMTYVCPKGYRAYPLSWRICQKSGLWSQLYNAYDKKEKEAKCVAVTCIKPTTFEYGSFEPYKEVYNINDTIIFNCYDGYLLLGSTTRTCLANGQWSGRMALCHTEDSLCPNPGIPIGGHRVGQHFAYHSYVQYSCGSYELRGSAERVCLLSGRWSGEEPRCEKWVQFDNKEDLEKELIILDSQILASTKTSQDKDLYPLSGNQHKIFILVDCSKNVGEENFDKSLNFVSKVIQKFSAHNAHLRYGVITFGSAFTIKVKVEENWSTEELIEAVKNISYNDLLNHQSKGSITVAMEEVFQIINKQFELKNTKYTIIVIISGMSKVTNPRDVMKRIAEHLWKSESKLDVLAIGIGNIMKTQIESLVPQQRFREEESRQYSFYLPYYHDLEKIFEGSTGQEAKDMSFSECGVQESFLQRPVGRIFGGRSSAQGDWPWQAYISFPDKDIKCSGSVIGRRWILSAAHCFERYPGLFKANEITIFLGITKYTVHEQGVKVDKVIQHDKWNSTTWDYDIALLKLATELQYSKLIRPVCLPCTDEVVDLVSAPQSSWSESCKYQENLLTVTKGENLEKELVGYVAGWGYTMPNTRAKDLQHTKVLIKPRHMCGTQILSILFTENMFCAKGASSDSCKGDSGGPLVMKVKNRWIQVGIVSYGRYFVCGQKDFMGFYTNVPHMMSWIQSNIAVQ